MGMYTEINFRAALKRDTPEAVLKVLSVIAETTFPLPDDLELPDHILFQESSRWSLLGNHGSYYFPAVGQSELIRAEKPWENHRVAVIGNIKNYGMEIEAFFEWINPYVHAPVGEYLGYKLYEEDQEGSPTLYFKTHD